MHLNARVPCCALAVRPLRPVLTAAADAGNDGAPFTVEDLVR